MLKITIPGQENLNIKQVVFDFNGTLATDGKIHSFLTPLFARLQEMVDIYVLTADTYGSVQTQCGDLGFACHILTSGCGTAEKRSFVQNLGAEATVCVGNGVNDGGMFEISALSIIIMGEEGCAVQTLNKADIVVKNSEDAVNLLLHPKRITATLRT